MNSKHTAIWSDYLERSIPVEIVNVYDAGTISSTMQVQIRVPKRTGPYAKGFTMCVDSTRVTLGTV